jgi:hypothetical protein
MSTDELAHGEQLPVPRRRGPAFGEAGPPPAAKTHKKDAGPLDRRTEIFLALAVVIFVMAMYGAIGYGLYALVTSFG